MRGEDTPTTVGIPELRAELSRYVDQVKAGNTVTIIKPRGTRTVSELLLEDRAQPPTGA